MGAFKNAEFARLLLLAKGDRSINQYGLKCGVDPGYISRLIRELVPTPPLPPTIKKLANNAYNGITYEDLMISAGHLEETPFYAEEIPYEGKLFFRKLGALPPEDQKQFLESLKTIYINPTNYDAISPLLPQYRQINSTPFILPRVELAPSFGMFALTMPSC